MGAPDIMFCLPDFAGGGAQRVMLTLINSYKDANVKSVVLQEKGHLRGSISLNCDIRSLNSRSARSGLFSLARTFKEERPQVVFSTMAYFNFAVMLGLLISGHKPQRIVLREANTPSSTLNATALSGLYRQLYRWLYNRADIIICNSNQVRSELEQLRVNQNKIHLIPNPVDVKSVRRKARIASQFPDFDNPSLPLFVSIGRLTEQKGMDRLIGFLSQMRTPANLLIIGDGPQAAALLTQINDNNLSGRISVLGYQDNPFPFLVKATAFLLASHWEGLPNVGLESLALGKQVIATSTSGGLVDLCDTVSTDTLIIAEDDAHFIAAMDNSAQENRVCESALAECKLPEHYHQNNVIKRYKKALTPSEMFR